ncbi:MAG: dCMP deaminase family protein [Brevundimonas sp.]|nr:dCMP deaminase family protein [Brevundimonas sp.]
MIPRPDRDAYFLLIAQVVALRSTCSRRRVGCVLVDPRGRILSTGYNGVARGLAHCIQHNCPGARHASGTGLDLCEAIHAEANAITYCPDVFKVDTIYCTTQPCVHCIKLCLTTSAKRLVFLETYPHRSSESMWKSTGRDWEHYRGTLPAQLVRTENRVESSDRSDGSQYDLVEHLANLDRHRDQGS